MLCMAIVLLWSLKAWDMTQSCRLIRHEDGWEVQQWLNTVQIYSELFPTEAEARAEAARAEADLRERGWKDEGVTGGPT